MTFYNPLANLNMSNFMDGLNFSFTPTLSFWSAQSNPVNSWFSSWNTVWNTQPDSANSWFSNWNTSWNNNSLFNSFNTNDFWTTPSVFNSSQPIQFDFNNLFSTTNIWDRPSNNIWSQASFSFPESKTGDSFTTTNKNKKDFSITNYDSESGEKLAQTALQDSVGFKGNCARYVKRAIEKCGLGSYQYGHAYQMTNILRGNKHFKEVSPSEFDVQSLPAGCILVYNKGAEGYSSEYGHTEITTGDGRAVSDGITDNLHKKPSAIFVPITA